MFTSQALSHALTNNKSIGYILSVIRIYYGYNWFTAGLNKMTSEFDIVGFFNFFVLSEHSNVLFQVARGEWGATIWLWFVESIFIPAAPLLNIAVPLTEMLVGVLLLLGLSRVIICLVANFLNITFIMSGVVWPGIHYLFFQSLIALASNKHEICLDNYLKYKKLSAQAQ